MLRDLPFVFSAFLASQKDEPTSGGRGIATFFLRDTEQPVAGEARRIVLLRLGAADQEWSSMGRRFRLDPMMSDQR